MKHCLITGGGSKFGKQLTETLIESKFHVHLITGTPQPWANHPQIDVVSVDWKTIGIKDIKKLIPKNPIDLMFFNHNASALSQAKFEKNTIQSIEDWRQSYFVACQLPFYLIHASSNQISVNTKIGWMLSELIKHPVDSQVGFADYIGNKFTNACIMKSFALNFPACFFGINPDQIDQCDNLANKMLDLIVNTPEQTLNGNVFYSNGKIFNIDI